MLSLKRHVDQVEEFSSSSRETLLHDPPKPSTKLTLQGWAIVVHGDFDDVVKTISEAYGDRTVAVLQAWEYRTGQWHRIGVLPSQVREINEEL